MSNSTTNKKLHGILSEILDKLSSGQLEDVDQTKSYIEDELYAIELTMPYDSN